MFLRWAAPHKGPPLHLTGLEYGLRMAVFYPLFIAAFLPTVFIGVFLAFAGPFGIAVYIGLTGMASPDFVGFSDYEKQQMLFYGTIWLLSFVVSMFIRQRYLTPR